MPYLAAAVVLLGLLCVLNLALTLAIARRLRERAGPTGSPRREQVLAPPGGRVGAFTATAHDGSAVTGGELAAGTVVGFFTPDCEPCRLALPQFARYAGAVPGGPARVLAVITVPEGEEAVAAAPAALLDPVARVVVEPPRGPVQRAFGASAFPVFGLLAADGRIAASAATPEALPALARS